MIGEEGVLAIASKTVSTRPLDIGEHRLIFEGTSLVSSH